MKNFKALAVAVLVTVSAVSNSYAIFGVGLHWGFDYSMGMDNVERENIKLGSIAGLEELGDRLFYVSRMNWERSMINFGGKAYIDIIPFIQTVELSCNFGLWHYEGALYYPDIEASLSEGRLVHSPNPLDLNLKSIDGLSYIGLTGTPYAKLHFDATVRRKVWEPPIFKFELGAGLSAHLATPLLSNRIVEKAMGVNIDPADIEKLADPESSAGKAAAKKIVKTIIDEALDKPAFGMHILFGVKAKLPVLPLGVYVDSKYMIPFSKFDSDAGDGVNGFGLLVNAGLSFSL